MANPYDDRERKKGASEMLVLSLLAARARHGYEIGKLIAERSDGALQYGAASLYPLLYRLEKRGFVEGRWVEKAGERRRRFYKLTPEGRAQLRELRADWRRFLDAIVRVAELGRG
ncbi:MAG: PadR family transcriptional regulator [Acidobacteria bacterium]|nr:PadR family transcriptional regulator [Acidobacteriota bacterium]